MTINTSSQNPKEFYVSLVYPLYYVDEYLKNEYVLANDVAKHVHLFDHKIKYVDYSIFDNLRKNVKSIKIDTKDEYSGYTQKSFDIYQFNKANELTSIEHYIKNDTKYRGITKFEDNLKSLKSIHFFASNNEIITKSARSEYLNNLLEYTENSDESLILTDGGVKLISRYDNNLHYIFMKNGTVRKIYYQNSKEEQSKTIVKYDINFKIISSKTFSQRKDKKLLSECEFIYDKNRLSKVIFNYPEGRVHSCLMDYEEHNFKYNEKGLLIEYEDVFSERKQIWVYDSANNPVRTYVFYENKTIPEGAVTFYEYDEFDNWIQRELKFNLNTILTKRDFEYY